MHDDNAAAIMDEDAVAGAGTGGERWPLLSTNQILISEQR
jgi:hypothetical protein